VGRSPQRALRAVRRTAGCCRAPCLLSLQRHENRGEWLVSATRTSSRMLQCHTSCVKRHQAADAASGA
jgi:hypothetical protein